MSENPWEKPAGTDVEGGPEAPEADADGKAQVGWDEAQAAGHIEQTDVTE